MKYKIKISLPESVLSTMKSDCKNFNFLKSDDSINFNAFVNTLVVNFYETFSASEEALRDDVSKALLGLPDKSKERVYSDVIKIIARRENVATDGKTAVFSFKPTKLSEKAVTFIENVALSDESLSSFYRRMFMSYASRPQPRRELIIFKENYNDLQKAIRKNLQVCIVNKGDEIKNASVYAVASSKEELYNYVLSTDGQNLYTLRLANVKSVSLLTKKADIPEDIKQIFDRQIRCGAQYPIFKNETDLIKVVLSQKGKYLFKKIYLYRPTPVKIENDAYYFDCSTNQAMHYFKRFGVDGIIVSPENVAKMMYTYYAGSARKYSRVVNDKTPFFNNHKKPQRK